MTSKPKKNTKTRYHENINYTDVLLLEVSGKEETRKSQEKKKTGKKNNKNQGEQRIKKVHRSSE